MLFTNLKQYEEAIPRLEEVLVIRQKVFGGHHKCTVETTKELAGIREWPNESIAT